MGSKNQIAEWVVDVLPPAENLYDLFAGGCAVTHAAMVKHKYQNFIVNDINDTPKLFCDAVNGKYQNEQRWISREDFFRLKDTDLYVKQCWSFGNDGRSYLYSKEIEPYKKALHYARVFGDYSLLKEMGINGDGSRRDIGVHKDEYKSRYIKWWLGQQGYTTESLENLIAKCKNDTKQIPQDYNEVYGLHQLWQSLERLERLESLERLQSLESLERLERLQSLERLESLESLERLQRLQGDYQDVVIKDNSIVYCDVPYKGTKDYGQAFDHERFYIWCEKQTQPVFISEYDMSEDRFACIAEKPKRVLLNHAGEKKLKMERIFMPIHQAYLYSNLQAQVELFGAKSE